MTGVYSTTNWPPFTRGQNSNLNWVLKLSPLIQKVKSNKNCIDLLERTLLILFLPLGVIKGVKSLHRKKKVALKRKRLGHQKVHGKMIWKPGGLNPQLQYPQSATIKLNPLWKTEVSKSAWITPWVIISQDSLLMSLPSYLCPCSKTIWCV